MKLLQAVCQMPKGMRKKNLQLSTNDSATYCFYATKSFTFFDCVPKVDPD